MSAAGFTLHAQLISSDFATSADGWTTPADADATITWTGTGGNPGGQVSGSPYVLVLGATTLYIPFFFEAPAKFRGNRSAYYDGTLRFDLQQVTSNTSLQAAEVQIFNNAGVALYYYPPTPFQPPAQPAWTTYSVNLGAASGYWKTTDSPTGPAATEATLRAFLADIATLQIRGLFRNANVLRASTTLR